VIMAALGGCSGNNEEASSEVNDTDVLTDISEVSEETDSDNIEELPEENSENDNLNKDTDKGSVTVDISEEDKALLEKVCEGGFLVMYRDGSFDVIGEEEGAEYAEKFKFMLGGVNMLSDEFYEDMLEFGISYSREEYAAIIYESYPPLKDYFDIYGNLKNKNDVMVIVGIEDNTYNYNENNGTVSSEKASYRVWEWVIDTLKGDEELRTKYIAAAEKSAFEFVVAFYECDENGVIEARLQSYSGEGETDIEEKLHVSGK
ncbi:MAG: hypothetical protein K2N72_09785, partial [Oscillospiraceae bacterium]|nr:hypothetical protein [Oscillospiraceae bacterium]